jgi:hypothetical protein
VPWGRVSDLSRDAISPSTSAAIGDREADL